MQSELGPLNLASERLGATVEAANDDFFAEKENLIKASKPVWLPEKFNERGKWMDGWESRRRRVKGDDWCVVRLGVPGTVSEVVVDTAHFTGNYPEECSVEGATFDGYPNAAVLEAYDGWEPIVARSPLQGDTAHHFASISESRFTHVRLRIFPDGGVARLRVLGEPVPDFPLERERGWLDVGSATLGARAVDCSDRFYSDPNNLCLPGRAINMGDGWETKRRRDDGNDWAIIRLACVAELKEVIVDTTHFKGNAPGRVSIEVCTSGEELPGADVEWRTLLPETPTLIHTQHRFQRELADVGEATHARIQIYPDGGLSRLRLFGAVGHEESVRRSLRWLNSLPVDAAERTLLTCCGSTTFARKVAAARPFQSLDALLATAEQVWLISGAEDRLEAFKAHPRIGGKKAEQDMGPQSKKWSSGEQAGVDQATRDTRTKLAFCNDAYFDKFGFIFIVFATGKSADEMLGVLQSRLGHERHVELEIAAAEQAKITRLRLQKLIAG